MNIELYKAIRTHNFEAAKMILDENPEEVHANLNILYGATWLHFAVKKQAYEIVEYLIKLGADVNAKTQELFLNAPIAEAALVGDLKAVKLLREHGAHFDFENENSLANPLFGAIDSGSLDIVKFLLNEGIDPKRGYGENYKVTALVYALMYSKKEIANFMANFMAENDLKTSAEELLEEARAVIDEMRPPEEIQIVPT